MTLVAIVITAVTLVAMLVRPRGISEAACAGVGGAAMLLTRAVSLSDAWRDIRHSGDILLFLLGMMILTTVIEPSGVFDYLAEGCARLALGRGLVELGTACFQVPTPHPGVAFSDALR